jgi:hypothetical protein
VSELKLDGNAQSVVTEILRIVDATLKTEQAGEKLVRKSKEQADEERRLARLRKGLLDEQLSGIERAEKKIADFEKAIAGQGIEEEKVGRVRAKLNADLQAALDAAFGKTARLASEEEERNQKLKEQAEQERRLAAARDRYFSEYERQSDKAKRRIDEFEAAIKGQAVEEKKVAEIRAKLHAEHEAALVREKAGLEGVTGAIDDTEAASITAFGAGAVKRLGAFAAGAISIQGAVGLVRKELEAIQDLIDESVKTQVTLDQSRSVVRRNLGGASDEEIKRVQEAATRIADDTGVSERDVNIGLATALSASGLNIDASVKAVTAASRFSPDSPGDIGLLAGALLDLAKATGTDDATVNLGYLSAIGAQGRVVDTKQQAANLAPGVIGTLAFGGNYRESGAALAALTNASADFTGAPSSTAIIQLARQLETFDKANESFDANSIGGRIAALQNDRVLAEQFLADASFEAKSVGVIRELLTNERSVAAREYQNSLRAIPDIEGLRERGERSIDVLDADNPAAATARRERAIARMTEAAFSAETEESLSRDEIENLKRQLQKVGKAYRTEADLLAFSASLDGDGVTGREAVDAIRGKAERLGSVTYTPDYFGGGGTMLAPKEEQLQTAQALNALGDKLDRLLVATEKQTIEVKKNKPRPIHNR